jgi:predicted GNAT family acetyltransferase
VIEVRDAPERARYEILVDGTFAGYAHYQPYEGSLVFDHTVIKEDFAGQGLASKLARGALDDVRSQQGRIVPLCEYIAGWLEKNTDYDDLVDRGLLARILATA